MELYDAMSTLRAVRRLRPDPIPGGGAGPGVHCRHLGADGRQRAALADHRGQRRSQKAGAGGFVPIPLAGLRSRLPPAHGIDASAAAGEVGTYARRRRLSVRAHARSAGDSRVLLQPAHHGDHRRGSAPGRASSVADRCTRRCRTCCSRAATKASAACSPRSCAWTSLPWKALLELPDDWYTCAHVPIGYPVGSGHGRIARRPKEKMVFDDRWEG